MQIALPPDLTVAQAGIWLDQCLFPGRPIYNIGGFLAIRGDLHFDLLDAALRQTVAESPSLRLPPRTGALAFDLPVLDFRDRKDSLAAALQWMRAEMARPLSLDDPALFRFALLRIGAEQTLWFLKAHHLIIDAVGCHNLHSRTAARYRVLRFGEPLAAVDSTTPEEILDRERRYAASRDYEVDRAYWLERLAHWPGPLLDVNRENTERSKSGRAARISFTLKRADFARLVTAARKLGASAFRGIMALSYVAFSRLYDRSDLVLGFELANRPGTRSKQLIGLMLRDLPLPLKLDPRTTTVADLVHHLEQMRTADYRHHRFPLQDLIKGLGITQRGHHGLFDIIVNYIPLRYHYAFEGPVEYTNLSYGLTVPWLLTIEDPGSPHDVDVNIDTDPGLVSAELATRLASMIEALLLHGMDDLDCPLAALPIMPEATSRRLHGLAAGPTIALPERTTLTTRCAAQAQQTPDAIALIDGDQQLSFATLHDKATRLARRLAALGVRPGVVVGIALPRTSALIVAVLAVHKAGGAYLALEPTYPAERIRFVVSDIAAPVIVTNPAFASLFANSGAHLVLDLDAVDGETADPIPARSDDLAYVLYTSGSTGRPKAVGIEHHNLINLVSWGRSILSDAELRGVLFSTSLNFDLSAFEMFLPLAFGGCIVLAENLLALKSAPQRDQVRFVNTGPSVLETLLHVDGLPPGVTSVVVCGEKLSRRLATLLFAARPGIRLFNCYGPTEATVYSSWAHIDSSDLAEPTIGRPIWNTTLHVLGAGMALLPPGSEGELFIGGTGVARGYLGRPDLTAERFLANPYGPGRLYRTGDRARWGHDGNLEFLGRADDQIKIHGVRLEPGEIEAALLTLPEIDAAIVKLAPDATDTPRLTAYLVSSSEAPANDSGRLRAALSRQLPRYMIPSRFVWLDALPMTPNGKVDRKALPRPPREQISFLDDCEPTTELERELVAAWEHLLDRAPIGVRSDFFDLGGDSLALISLFATIEARYGRRLTVDVLAGGLSIAGLAQLLTRPGPHGTETDPLVPLQPFGDLPPLYCVHGISGDVLHYHRLAVHMGTKRPIFGLRRRPQDPIGESITETAARYVAAMLERQSNGPFNLLGYSSGVMIAYEMALQLLAQGNEIGLLAIIDQHWPRQRLSPAAAIPGICRILGAMPGRIRYKLSQVPTADRYRELRRLFFSWSKTALGLKRDAATIFEIDRIEAELLSRFDAALRALYVYRPAPSTVPITLFRAQIPPMGYLLMAPTLGWKDLTRGEVRVRLVPGDHHSMITEPLVRHLAKALSDELDAGPGRGSK
jgi:amino acid adenylation domain-containing protein